MPPKKKASGSGSLNGCCIAISGAMRCMSQAAIATDFIIPLGGTLSKSVTASTTHLISTQADYDKPTVKVKAAQSLNIHIVSFIWISDSFHIGSRRAEGLYALDPQVRAQYRSSLPFQQHLSQLRSRAMQAAAPGNQGVKRKLVADGDSDNDNDDDDDSDDDNDDDDDDKAQSHASKRSKISNTEVKQDEDQQTEAKVADGQIAKTRDVRIPLDDLVNDNLRCYEVYIDDDGVIFDASLNQTNAAHNNNKFYRLQLLRSVHGDFRCWTRWGRVGEIGSSKILGNGSLATALKEFEGKFKSKTGINWCDRTMDPRPGKYAFVERSYEEDSEDEGDTEKARDPAVKQELEEEPESKLSKPVQELMQLIFNQQYFAATMRDLNYDAVKLPLGKLSKTTISRGYQLLKDLAALLDDPSLAGSKYQTLFPLAAESLSNGYFSLIPHTFGRNKPPVIGDTILLKREIALLESLSDMKHASILMKNERKEVVNKLDQHFKSLGMEEMTPLDKDGSEFTQLKDYLMATRGSTHQANYEISQIFRIERQGEKDRFEAAHGNPRDRRLLWHGSRCTNFGGILSQGLRIAPPEAPSTVFGKGIYLADMSSKSAGYCHSSASNGHALLLLCEAELGDPIQKLTRASYDADEDAKNKGMLSTWGQGSTGPSLWKDAGCVHPSLKGVKMPDTTVAPSATGIANASLLYNEYICYDVSQVRLRYLYRVRI